MRPKYPRPASSFLLPLLFYSLYKGFSLVRFTISRARVHKRIRVYGSPQKSGRRNQFFSSFFLLLLLLFFFLSRTNCSGGTWVGVQGRGSSSVAATIVTKRKKNRYLSGEGISLIGAGFYEIRWFEYLWTLSAFVYRRAAGKFVEDTWLCHSFFSSFRARRLMLCDNEGEVMVIIFFQGLRFLF